MERLKNSPEENSEHLSELPKSSKDDCTKFYLHEIKANGTEGQVIDFINQQLGGDEKKYEGADEFLVANPSYLEQAHASLSEEEKSALRDYSSYHFAWINTYERGFWDYEKLGKKTPEKVAKIEEISKNVEQAIFKAPAPKEDFVTTRGTDLSGFRDYDIHSLKDLTEMKGQMMVERAYTSTAICKEKSFVDNESTLWIGSGNIEMRYHIPAGYKTSIAMLSHALSYSPGQTEVLLNCGTLSYVSNVEIDEANGRAVMDVIVVPSEIYEPQRIPAILGRQ